MATKTKHILHVGFVVPLNELLFENAALEHELGDLNLRTNVYSAVLFYKTTNQDVMHAWFEQRKGTSRNGYLRAYYKNKKNEVIIEMDVDGKQFYLIAAIHTSKPPVQMKQDIARGLFGERKAFAERIQVPCFAYKCDADVGFIESEALATYKQEQDAKKEALKSERQAAHAS